jgi:CheY-like chemotaxis protein
MNGYEAVTEIRKQRGPNQHVVIVAMTAEAMEGSRERCLDAGMDEVITKPVKQLDFLQALEQFVPRKAGTRLTLVAGNNRLQIS